MWNCVNCNEQMDERYEFCWKCGAKKVNPVLTKEAKSHEEHQDVPLFASIMSKQDISWLIILSLLFLGLLSSLGLLWVFKRDAAPPPVAERPVREPQIREGHDPKPEAISQSSQATLEFSVKVIPEPKCQGEVIGEVRTLVTYKKSLKSAIFHQQMPEVWLVFHRDSNKCDWPLETGSRESSTMDVRLSRAARRLLKSLWAKACVYYYYEMFEKQDLNARKSRFVAITVARVNTANELDGLFINAPDKRREFSIDERFALTWYITANVELN